MDASEIFSVFVGDRSDVFSLPFGMVPLGAFSSIARVLVHTQGVIG